MVEEVGIESNGNVNFWARLLFTVVNVMTFCRNLQYCEVCKYV